MLLINFAAPVRHALFA